MNTQPVPVWALLSNARKGKGLRMKQVAHDTGLSVHTVLNAEAEMVSTRVLFKLAQYYGIDGRALMASVLHSLENEQPKAVGQ